MLMKKITFNAPLNHKAYSYEPMQIEVEKVIPLYGKRFEQMRDHPLEDTPEIIENRDRKHGQFEWTPVAIIFGCLLFTLTAPLYIWNVVGL